ncbi:MAG TPA: HAMP domain-containing sensor histidine kinase [Gaiellaceae bacterium]|nr:HAMP domain-containing sensor histidine kinase [Gaiellaceae bacterium]
MKLLRRLRGVRTRLLLVVIAALAVALVVATIGFNVLLANASASDADSLLRQRAAAERGVIVVRNGLPHIVDTRDDTAADSRVWIFGRNATVVEEPRAHAATQAKARSLAGTRAHFVTVESTDERLYAAPILSHGQRFGTIVVGMSLAPYEQTRRSALFASLAFAATLLVVAGAAAAWLLRSALRPVALMTEQAAAWSEHDLDKRFALGEPTDELSRLAQTLDRLLDRISASLRHERRFSAELSHELRTPLSKVIAEAELALRRPRQPDEYRRAIREIQRNAEQVARIVETLLMAARGEAQPRGVADAAAVARAAVDACSPLAAEHRVSVAVARPATPVRVGVDQDLAERILHPVLENACRYGREHVHLSLARANGAVVFTVDDDGPGVREDEADAIFEPAARGSAGRAAGTGAGLGLALARRLARSVSGDVEAEPRADGGRFTVRLPAA